MSIPTRRWKNLAAMAMVGDGVMALVYPSVDVDTWKFGPKSWQQLMQSLHDRPMLTRALGAAEIVGGMWLALYLEKTRPGQPAASLSDETHTAA